MEAWQSFEKLHLNNHKTSGTMPHGQMRPCLSCLAVISSAMFGESQNQETPYPLLNMTMESQCFDVVLYPQDVDTLQSELTSSSIVESSILEANVRPSSQNNGQSCAAQQGLIQKTAAIDQTGWKIKGWRFWNGLDQWSTIVVLRGSLPWMY